MATEFAGTIVLITGAGRGIGGAIAPGWPAPALAGHADRWPCPAAAAPPAGPAFRQFPVAWRFAPRNQARNRLAWLLLVGFVPVWYELMLGIAGHAPLTFQLYATGRVLTVDGGYLTLVTAGLNSVTMTVGFAVFPAVCRTLAFDKRLVFAGYRQAALIGAKSDR